MREEGKLLGAGGGGNKGQQKQAPDYMSQRTEIHTVLYSNDSTRAIHGEEQVDDTHMYICILMMY